ncbi:hypothetical protein OCU04_002401 [Sclerotinia nivalis]|uniref:Uncharacterized protein n=1 Tax=Sclerotinia nivalis TaxID=352851 RepID=A0A9X0DP10_9HELO|nr:hypothetical protein OCU04_002401 [Sclerotinia nivalis]
MAPAPATLSDNEKCLIAALSQFASDDNKFPALNNAKLAEDLGLPTPNAARVRWARLTAKIKEGKFGDLKITAGDKNQKRNKDEAGFEGNDEEMADVTSPTKKQKSGATRKKAGEANGKFKKDVSDESGQEEKFMDGEVGSSFNVFEDLDAV